MVYWDVPATSLGQLSRLRQVQKAHQAQALAHGCPQNLIPSSNLMLRPGFGVVWTESIPSQQFRCSPRAGRSEDRNHIGGKGISSNLVYLLICRCNHPVLVKTEWQKGLDLPFSLPTTGLQKLNGLRCKKHWFEQFLHNLISDWSTLSLHRCLRLNSELTRGLLHEHLK